MNDESDTINIAMKIIGTRALGPGLRAVIWVQGCEKRCPGCIAGEWADKNISNPIPIESLSKEILANPDICGITFSGGEPMLQAEKLASLVRLVRLERDLDVLCFTGYNLKEIIKENRKEMLDFLSLIDVLIDGPYIESLNDGLGLRGSSNQQVYHFSERMKSYNFENVIRQGEIRIQKDMSLVYIGIPNLDINQVMERVEKNLRR